MKYTTHHKSEISAVGTSLQGYVDADYQDLVKAFGPSSCWDDAKSDAEWAIRFEDGTVATIYNYKDGFNYLGSDGLAVEDIIDWHVGGSSKRALELVNQVLTAQRLGE